MPISAPALRASLMLLLLLTCPLLARAAVAPVENWQDIIRNAPYWTSQGVYSNMLTIRRWVLEEAGYCSDQERHLLFDHRGQFLGYISNGKDRSDTQQRLNSTREQMAANGRATGWTPGSDGVTGYPFALGCDQPHARLAEARARYLGAEAGDRLWGRWDDLNFASQGSPGNLHQALLYVVSTRQQQQRLNLPDELPRYLAGMILVESGARARAHSSAGAIGILQLMPRVLNDCGVAQSNHWHRLAQIDCALRLMMQNARNLRPVFDERFGHLPDAKRDQLFSLLLIQAYHGGAARVSRLMDDEELAGAARYFAEHHDRFSAGDIAFGMVFHNLGRDRLGLASLYYVADVELATEALCQHRSLRGSDFCSMGDSRP